MKKILFLLFALTLGVGISAAFADMQPPGLEITTIAPAADVVSNEMPVPAFMNVVSQEMATQDVTYLFQKVSIDVESGSSGGLAYLCLRPGNNELQPLNWNYFKDQCQSRDKDRAWCTQKAFSKMPTFAVNCNFKFPI